MSGSGEVLAVANLAVKIAEAIERVKTNKRRLMQLSKRINALSRLMEDVEQKLDPKVKELGEDLAATLIDIHQFIIICDTKGWLKRLVLSKGEKDAIDEFNNNLLHHKTDITMAITARRPSSEGPLPDPMPQEHPADEYEDYLELLQTLEEEAPDIEEDLVEAEMLRSTAIAFYQHKLTETIRKTTQTMAMTNSTVTATSESTGSQPSHYSSGPRLRSFPASGARLVMADEFQPNLRSLSRASDAFIASGAFGSVYRCEWVARGDIIVAVKVLHVAKLSQRAEEELVTEAEAMRSLGHHDNVVDLFGLYMEGESFAMVMSHIPGGTLRDRLNKRGKEPISWEQRWFWASGIAKGMAWLHSAKPAIVHRDLKSENILLDAQGRPLITDFGCAFAKDEMVTNPQDLVQSIAGSIPWMPPEALVEEASKIQDCFGDLYAYAMVMVEMATGGIPWMGYGSRPSDIRALVLNGKRPRMDPMLVQGDPQFFALMEDCWRQERLERPPFAEIAVRASKRYADLHKLEATAMSAKKSENDDAPVKRKQEMSNVPPAPKRVPTDLSKPIASSTPVAPRVDEDDLEAQEQKPGTTPMSSPAQSQKNKDSKDSAEESKQASQLSPTFAVSCVGKYRKNPRAMCWTGVIILVAVSIAIILGVVLSLQSSPNPSPSSTPTSSPSNPPTPSPATPQTKVVVIDEFGSSPTCSPTALTSTVIGSLADVCVTQTDLSDASSSLFSFDCETGTGFAWPAATGCVGTPLQSFELLFQCQQSNPRLQYRCANVDSDKLLVANFGIDCDSAVPSLIAPRSLVDTMLRMTGGCFDGGPFAVSRSGSAAVSTDPFRFYTAMVDPNSNNVTYSEYTSKTCESSARVFTSRYEIGRCMPLGTTFTSQPNATVIRLSRP